MARVRSLIGLGLLSAILVGFGVPAIGPANGTSPMLANSAKQAEQGAEHSWQNALAPSAELRTIEAALEENQGNREISQSSTKATGPGQRLQQGRQLYQAGRFFEAALLWQEALEKYEAGGAILNQAQALNYISLANQDLGEWQKAERAIAKSLSLLENYRESEPRGTAIIAQALNTRGSLELARGQTQAALETWQQAEQLYDSAGNENGKLGSQINQAGALQSLGYYRRAEDLLEGLIEKLQEQPDSRIKAQSLRSLGIALQTVGDLGQSKEILEESWGISSRMGDRAEIGATLFSIGNIARDIQEYDVAIDYYREAAERVETSIDVVQAQLNQLAVLTRTRRWEAAIALIPEIQSRLSGLSPSRSAVYARVNLAESLIKISNGARRQKQRPMPEQIARELATALSQAQQLRDERAEAYARDRLGHLYENQKQWREAELLTEKALEIAQRINAEDIVARTSWQLGRILKQKGERNKALSAYRTSFNTLQALRGDLVAINPDVQFDFKESVEPVYREFVGLLLQGELKQGTGRPGDWGNWGQEDLGTKRLGDKETWGQRDLGTKKTFPYTLHPRPHTLLVAQENGVTQENLQEARLVIEALQLAELDNFFREACLEAVPQKIDDIDPTAAVIYPIILTDRLEVIVSLANRPLLRYTTRLPRQEVQRILQEFHSSLHVAYSDEIRLALAEQIYKWLIRPAEAELASGEIKTLVFVLDGFFRSIPMAALYDGEQYLVEKYGIALSPGLQLFPEGLERKTLSALAVGLTEARQGFSALPEVSKEVKQIAAEVKSKVLLDSEFTRAIFTEEVNSNPTSVVHLATHGQFSSNPEETFLLAWDDRIRIRDFDRLFYQRQKSNRSPVELLVLSACQTATGDRRATLGLAGFALRSGARSTLATLWSVNDRSTADLMAEFYQELTEYEGEINKAQALREAQLKLLQNTSYDHPYFWAPFVLVGNWL